MKLWMRHSRQGSAPIAAHALFDCRLSVQPESCWAPNALCAWASMLEASLAPDPCCMSVRIPEGGGAAAL
eukprot:1160285-Pelagomonas_calceolata.AAC.3